MTRWTVAAVVLAAAACGGGGGGDDGDDTGDDAPPIDARPDAEVVDAPVDAEVADAAEPDAAPVSEGTFVADRILTPASVAEVQMYSLDLDGDQPGGDLGVDNQLGAVFNALNQMGLSVQPSLDVAVQTGAAIALVAVDSSAVSTAIGIDPDPPACSGPGDCGHHLEGDATFTIGSTVGTMPLGAGPLAGPGTAVLPITVLGSSVIELEMIGARFEGTFEATGFAGKLAGVIPEAVIGGELVPALAVGLQLQVAIDCPGTKPPDCGCAPDSPGETLINTFDLDDNCALSAAELADNPLIQGFLTSDVTYEGVDGLSFGVRLTGVTGVYTVP
jgi:hypothetical protein